MALALLGAVPAVSAPTHAQTPGPTAGPQVTIDAGTLAGARDTGSGVAVFRGIPYAAPPVGDLRWRPPGPPARWEGVRAATAPGPSCVQPGTDGVTGPPLDQQGEDCLYLNVWTAAFPEAGGGAGARRPLRPVMVWVHGGGYAYGAGSWPGWDGHVLARKGVVLVTPNYRLGPFGYLAHPALAAEDPHRSAGNYGLLDQVAALQWVRRNIARFGGDSTRVTLVGVSAGAFAVGTLLASPMAEGLFHRAILGSGTGMLPEVTLPRAVAEARARLRAAGLGIPDPEGAGPSTAAALRALDARAFHDPARATPDSALLAVGRWGAPDAPPFRVTFAPVVDGWAVPLPPDSAVARGAWNRVPVLVGSTADEGTFLAGETPLRTVAGYTAMLAGYGDARGTLARTYPAADSAAVLPAVQRLAGDMFMGAPARALARLATRGGAPAYLYLFTRVAEGPDAMRGASASHGTDLPFIFGVRAGAGVYRFTGRAAYDSTLAEAMSDYWVAFTASGDPNGAPTSGKWPRWPAYDARTDAYLELGREIVAKRGLRKAEYDVHDALARMRGEVRP